MMYVLMASLPRAAPKNVSTLGWGGRLERISISRDNFVSRFPQHTLAATTIFFHLASYTDPNPPSRRSLPIRTSLMSMMGLDFASAPPYREEDKSMTNWLTPTRIKYPVSAHYVSMHTTWMVTLLLSTLSRQAVLHRIVSVYTFGGGKADMAYDSTRT